MAASKARSVLKERELEKIVCAGKERKVGLVSLFKAINAKMTVIFNLMIE